MDFTLNGTKKKNQHRISKGNKVTEDISELVVGDGKIVGLCLFKTCQL